MICGAFSWLFSWPAAAGNSHESLEFFHRQADNASNKTRQGYARERILKPAGYFFLGHEKW